MGRQKWRLSISQSKWENVGLSAIPPGFMIDWAKGIKSVVKKNLTRVALILHVQFGCLPEKDEEKVR